MILTENICKLIFNLAWDSIYRSSKHHSFIHVEIPACSYVYMHVTTNSCFLFPFFFLLWPGTWLCRASANKAKPARQFHCSNSLPASFFPGTKDICSYNMTLSSYCQNFLSFLFLKKLKCLTSIRCSSINAYIPGVIKIPNFWLPENCILDCLKGSLGRRSREVILLL